MKYPISLNVNGQDYAVEVEPTRLLVDILRYDIGLTGTKEGCSVGVCGACTVLVDGEIISSCLMPGVSANGSRVITVEGLAEREELLPIQQALSGTAASNVASVRRARWWPPRRC